MARDLVAEADAREAAQKAARVKAAAAKAEAEGARARANMEAAVQKKGTPIKDADIEKMKQSMGTAEKKPKGQLGKKAKAAKQASIEAPKPAMSAPKAAKTIAQEVAEVKPNLPMKPLPGQGSMEGKPVVKSTVKVSEAGAKGVTPEAVKAWKAGQDADRRKLASKAPGAERRAASTVEAPKAAPDKVMTPEGTVEPKVTPKPAAPVGPAKMTSADLFGTPEAAAKPAIPKMTSADLFGGPKKTLAQKAGMRIKSGAKSLAKGTWETIKTEAKAADPTAPFRELRATKGAARTSWDVTKAGVRGGYRLGKGLLKGAGEGILIDFAAQKGWDIGTEANKTFHTTHEEFERQKRAGAKRGLEVSGGDQGMKAVGKALVRGFTLGQVDLGSDIQVREKNPSLSAKRRAQGQAKFEANRAKSSDSEVTPEYIENLRKTSSRRTIKG